MLKQVNLVACLVSLAIIEETEVIAYAKEHRSAAYAVDRSFNIMAVDPDA